MTKLGHYVYACAMRPPHAQTLTVSCPQLAVLVARGVEALLNICPQFEHPLDSPRQTPQFQYPLDPRRQARQLQYSLVA